VPIRRAVTVLCLLAAALAARAAELPPPPDGFDWQAVPRIQGSVVVPKGWSDREDHDGKTLTMFITEKPFAPPRDFDVGLTVSAFVGDAKAPEKVKKLLDETATKFSVVLNASSQGRFHLLACKFDSPRKKDGVVVRTYQLGIANPETRTAYLLVFESPVSRWEEVWPKGEAMLNHLALDPDL
jgi:hypothetical protein